MNIIFKQNSPRGVVQVKQTEHKQVWSGTGETSHITRYTLTVDGRSAISNTNRGDLLEYAKELAEVA
jgi:hypothetical protein